MMHQRLVAFLLLREVHFLHPKPKLKVQSHIFLPATEKMVAILKSSNRQQTLMRKNNNDDTKISKLK